MGKDQISALSSKTARAAADGQYELFKTTDHFDSAAKQPEWLGGDRSHEENGFVGIAAYGAVALFRA